MNAQPTENELIAALDAGTIVPLSVATWTRLAPAFKVVRKVATGLGGEMVLVKRPVPNSRRLGWALVEDPQPGEKVVRPLASEKEARALIADRLAAYERMWDG